MCSCLPLFVLLFYAGINIAILFFNDLRYWITIIICIRYDLLLDVGHEDLAASRAYLSENKAGEKEKGYILRMIETLKKSGT